MAISRSRTRVRKRTGKQSTISLTTETESPRPETSRTVLINESCEDVIGNITGDNPFFKRTVTRTGGFYNGRAHNYEWVNMDAIPTPSLTGSRMQLSNKYIQRLLYSALAKTGPQAPSMQLPVSIYELKDLPGMLLHAGNLLLGLKNLQIAKQFESFAGDQIEHLVLMGRTATRDPVKGAAAATLAYQFGWKPLIDDIRKLLDFRVVIEKRLRILDRAYNSKSGYHGHAVLDQSSKTVESLYTQPASSYFTVPDRRQTITTEIKTWAVVPWCPKERPPLANNTEWLKHEAFKAAFGANTRNVPLAVWKALPWSWFVDYFANIGEYLTVQQNLIDFVPQPGVIMVKRSTITRIEGFNVLTTYNQWLPTFKGSIPSSVSCDPFESILESKDRLVVPVWPTSNLPSMKMPILDTFKLSVLGSLAILSIAK